MRGWRLCCCVLAGCASEPVDSQETPPDDNPDEGSVVVGEWIEPESPHVGECALQASLYGMGVSGPTSLGPVTVDTTGIDICLSLDARDNLQFAHFTAGTDHEAGDSSSFELALFDRDGAPLRDGWDVSISGNPGTTWATLEYSYVKGQVYEAVLWVRAKTGSATTMVDVYLLEPFE